MQVNKSQNPKLFLITKEFPFGSSTEIAFLQNEFGYLASRYEVTLVVTEYMAKETDCRKAEKEILAGRFPIPEGEMLKPVKVVCIGRSSSPVSVVLSRLAFSRLPAVKEELVRIAARTSGNPGDGKAEKRRFLMFGGASERLYQGLIKAGLLTKDSDAVWYSFWNDFRVWSLCAHRQEYPGIRIISRIHGYDLYDEREIYGHQFFKEELNQKLDLLVFAAAYGRDWYLNRYEIPGEDAQRFPLCRLGVRKQDVRQKAGHDFHEVLSQHLGQSGSHSLDSSGSKSHDQSDSLIGRSVPETFTLVSCSNVIPLKHVEKIVDGLAQAGNLMGAQEKVIAWVHFGDGSQMAEIRERAEEKLGKLSGIRYQLMGAVSNQALLTWYQSHKADCFITATESEGGSPVSIQEALSFGIPVIGPSISDIPCMIDGNGLLLSENPAALEIGQAIVRMARSGNEETEAMRQRSLQIWSEHFDADANCRAFVELVDGVCRA